MENKKNKNDSGPSFLLGLTGGVGAGKSTVLNILKKDYGFYLIQTDLVARRLMEPGQPGYEAVCAFLGPSILNPDGTINRPAMADLIFGDTARREQVDRLTHPLVWKAVAEEAAEKKGCPVVIESAVPSKEFRDNCREMWYLYTSRENRGRRLKESRGYSDEKISRIMENQASEEQFFQFADHSIDNNGTEEETRAQVDGLLEGRLSKIKETDAS